MIRWVRRYRSFIPRIESLAFDDLAQRFDLRFRGVKPEIAHDLEFQDAKSIGYYLCHKARTRYFMRAGRAAVLMSPRR